MAMLGDPLAFPGRLSFEMHHIHCISVNIQNTSRDSFPEGNIHRLAKLFSTTVIDPKQRLQKEFDSLLMYRPKIEFTLDVSSHHIGPCSKSTLGVYMRAIKKKLGRLVPSEDLQKYVIGQEKGKTQWIHTSVDNLWRFRARIIPGNDMVSIINGGDGRGVAPVDCRDELLQGAGEGRAEKRVRDRNDERQNDAQSNARRSRDRSRDRDRSRSRHTCSIDRRGENHGERGSPSYELSNMYRRDRYMHRPYGRHRHDSFPSRNFGRRGYETRGWER